MPGIKDIAKGAAQSITGNIETAVIVIHDYRDVAKKSKISSKEDSAQILSALGKERINSTKFALENGTAPSFPNSKAQIFKIHFNPSNLMLNASSVPHYQKDVTNQGTLAQTVEDPTLYLTTTLHFDDMDRYDSFMWDKFTSGLTASGAANAAKMGADIAGKGKTYSVRPQVEALISALRNPFTRTVSFRWNSFSFIGQLTTVRAKYTMFSTSGNPVRAEVLLRLQHELDPVLLKNWYQDFEEAFGRTTDIASKIGYNTKNLLNFNF